MIHELVLIFCFAYCNKIKTVCLLVRFYKALRLNGMENALKFKAIKLAYYRTHQLEKSSFEIQ
jgi:hypothetical protein